MVGHIDGLLRFSHRAVCRRSFTVQAAEGGRREGDVSVMPRFTNRRFEMIDDMIRYHWLYFALEKVLTNGMRV